MLVFVLGLLLLGAAIGVVALALADDSGPRGVDRSLAAITAMNQAPPELAADLDPPFVERVLDPLRRRSLAIGRRILGADSAERIRRKLEVAGNPRDWSVDRVVSVKVMGAVVLAAGGGVLGLLGGAGPVLFVVLVLAGAGLGFLVPDLYLYQVTYARTEKMDRALPDAIDLLTISVEAGLGFDAALQQVARSTDGPLSEEFSRVLRQMQIGQSRSESLRALAARTNLPTLKVFVGAMVQADAFGIPVAQVLRIQSKEIRVKRRQRAETKAQQVPVKITVPLIICILPSLFVVLLGPAVLTFLDTF